MQRDTRKAHLLKMHTKRLKKSSLGETTSLASCKVKVLMRPPLLVLFFERKTGGRSPACGRGSVRVDLAQAPSSQRMSRAREATRQCQPLQIQSLQRWSRNHGPAYKWQRRANTLFHTLCPSSLEPAESSPSVQTCTLQKKATARARRAVVMLFVMNLKLALEYITPRLSAGFYCR